MNAIVSASVGRAIVLEGERIFSIEPGASETLVPRTQRDVPFLLGDARDLEILQGVTVDQVRAHLVEALRNDDALRWTLSLLDGDLQETTRVTLAKAAEPLLEQASTRAFVEGVLYAQPMPDDLDPGGAEKVATAAGCSTVLGILRELQERQPAIHTVYEAWEGLPTKLFGTASDRTRARAAMVRAGLFRSLVAALIEGRSPDAIVAEALTKPQIRGLPHSRDFLLRWVAQFARRLSGRTAELVQLAAEDQSEAPESQPGSPTPRLPGHLVKQRVDAQQAGIRSALGKGDIERASSMMTDLVEFQIANGGSSFAVKSLCNMAVEAQRRGMRSLQEQWTAEAVRVAPGDGWAWNQRGKALLDLNRSAEALEAYSQADVFGGGIVAKKGRAEVLKAMGRFDDALRLYEEAAELHPDDVFAKTGRAEVLKAMGRFDDALRLYEETARLHPEDAVATTGRAEVLKAMGRFDDALRLYEETAELHPDDVFAKTGRAEVLKAMGRFDDALRLYEQATKLHPENAVAKNGRATVLALLGRSKEALRALPKTNDNTHDGWVAQHIRGMIFLRMGDTKAAISLFEDGVRQCPFHLDKAYFRTALAVARLRQRQYAAAAAVLSQVELGHFSDVARLLQVHALGEMNRFEQAAEVSKSVSRPLPDLLENIRREVDMRYVLRTGRKWTDEELIRAETQGCLLAA